MQDSTLRDMFSIWNMTEIVMYICNSFEVSHLLYIRMVSFPYFVLKKMNVSCTMAYLTKVIKAIVDWAATPSEGGNADATTAAELCAATDADGKTALMFAKENVRKRA